MYRLPRYLFEYSYRVFPTTARSTSRFLASMYRVCSISPPRNAAAPSASTTVFPSTAAPALERPANMTGTRSAPVPRHLVWSKRRPSTEHARPRSKNWPQSAPRSTELNSTVVCRVLKAPVMVTPLKVTSVAGWVETT